MMDRRERPLIYLWHPNTRDRFSGYGLPIAPAHLVGIIMVDRPHRMDPNWLQDIHRMFGEYELVTMTQDGSRGIVCQMRIAEESRVHLRVIRTIQSEEIRHVLLPLLETPPTVTLAVSWDEPSGCWVSRMVRGGEA